MDHRVVVALKRMYPNGIPPQEIERVVLLAASFAEPTPAPRAAAPAPAKAAPPKRRGRPPKAPAARAPAPLAAAADSEGLSRAEQVRQTLRTAGALTAAQVSEQLGLEEGAVHPLLARAGARPVGELELEDGTVLKTYGLPG